jgi:hypothetical protein
MRLLWEDWENFITGGPDGDDDSEFPTISLGSGTGVNTGSLADYLGVPPGTDVEVSALPFRAYALIYNEWYRDQDLITEVGFSNAAGADSTTNLDIQQTAWERDYFTTARPWEQKGPSVTLPLGDEAPVATNADGSGGETIGIDYPNLGAGKYKLGASNPNVTETASADATGNYLYADLSSATAATINELREAFALQRYAEARARYGSRYVEYLRYLGIRSSDARLQRPEYLGGGKQTVQFSEVLQTAEGTDPVGELKGHGIGAMRSNRYRRFFEEHGYIVSLISLRPKTIYAQGLHRTWNRRTKEDFWQKELQHIGQQEILNKELYIAHTSPDDTFGWQDRYDEYRRTPSSIAGEFRDSTLNFWHMARLFGSDPALNDTFVNCVPSERNFAVPSQDVVYIMANHSMQARRMVSKQGTSFIY